MKKNFLSILLVFLGVFVTGCSTTHNAAPVINKSINRPTESKVQNATIATQKGFYTVKKGDTLYRIALEVGQNYRDIVVWNNLANPNDIKVDQVLRVLPPDTGSQTSAQVGNIQAPAVEVHNAAAASNRVENQVTKTSPRFDKKAYSDATVAEMQKPDTDSPAPAATSAAAGKAETATGVPVQTRPERQPSPDDDTINWIWPTEGRMVAAFEENKKGIDIAGKAGQTIVAAGPGKIMYAGSGIRGYGNLVIIKHNNNLLSAYAHNKTILVKEGQSVARGQKIAEMGNSDSDTVKLHFEIRYQGKPVDPTKYLPGH